MDEALQSFLTRHVQTFNAAIESGDFEPLLALFALDADLEFEGAPVGRFHGRDAIAAASDAQPPNDTRTVLDARVKDDGTGDRRILVDGRQRHPLRRDAAHRGGPPDPPPRRVVLVTPPVSDVSRTQH